jgi:asparagine synthase (glutamine-hydrolysing)
MCGICGACFTDSNRPVDADLLERMSAVIVHRGPDEGGSHIDGAVGIAMRRLSIIDLSTGSQPLFNEDRTVSVVFNGEIYNFQALRADLIDRGHQFVTSGDTEVIVHLYEEYGLDFVDHLNGMFAIALWDRAQRRFVLARDRLGKKPLYFTRTRDGLIFGSELKCLLQCDGVATELDQQAVYHYFTLGYIPHPHTIYQNIQQLPPAHRLVFQHGRCSIERYWNLPDRVDSSIDLTTTAEQLRELLQDAVKLRMISDVPLGAFLSGGLDSSIIVALMAQRSSAPIKTFHIDFCEPDFSEKHFARQVAQRYGTEHHELEVRPSALDVLDDLVEFFDEPFGDTSAVPTYYVSKLARQFVTVALAGDGGDEGFGGYRRYQRILARRNFPGWLRTGLGGAGRLIHACLPRTAPGRRFFRSLGMQHAEAFAVGTAELETRELLSRGFLERIGASSTFELLNRDLARADTSDALAPYTFLDTLRYLPDDILTKVDRMSMAHSLEVRAPLLDYRIFELAARLPHDYKIQGGETKLILKRAFSQDLPKDILQPRKRGFSMPMADWLRGELRGALEETLHDPAMASAGVFHLPALRGFAREHLSGGRDRSDLLWRYLFFVRWWHHQPSKKHSSLSTCSSLAT